MAAPIHDILKSYWGYDGFRDLQEPIIESVLSGRDTLALLPTGSGKSVCFQVPALARDGITLVISPLIALMKDQVQQLRKKGISALSIHTGMSYRELMKSMELALNGKIKLLYLSPERIQTRLFREFLPGLPVNLVAVDEAHCVSQWGYDFRPSYLQIASLREWLPDVPFLALTASATPLVQQDIITQLQLKKPAVLKGSFVREGLSYSCFEEENKRGKLLHILQQVEGSSIVYCRSRKRTEELSRYLNEAGIAATFYHAGLPHAARHERQQSWTTNQQRIMVSTNAFGMGIDKPDVRTVVHYDVPDCLENYYQEAGRAGRDRLKAYAILLYGAQDLVELREQLEKKFPSAETVRDVYRHLVHFLQLPVGAAVGQSFDFDFNLFCERFGLDRITALNALQILQAEGYCSVSEAVYQPGKVCFTANREALESIEQSDPALDGLVKALLRRYEGIFNYPASISEPFLARQLQSDPEEIVQHLQALARRGILSYEPAKDKPLLTLLAERMAPENLRISQPRIDERKKLALDRLNQLRAYIDGSGCRSAFIGRYFGDSAIPDCGICDNCLRKKKKPAAVDALSHEILSLLKKNDSVSVVQLQQGLGSLFEETPFWKAVRYLEESGQLEVTAEGFIRGR